MAIYLLEKAFTVSECSIELALWLSSSQANGDQHDNFAGPTLMLSITTNGRHLCGGRSDGVM